MVRDVDYIGTCRKEIQYRGFKNKIKCGTPYNTAATVDPESPAGSGRGIGKGGYIPRGGFRSGGMQSFFFFNIIFGTAGRNQIPHDAVAGKTRGRNHSLNSNKQQEQHTRR